ncbi:MAG: MFS transporter [Candidatus Bathyarchaeia archaeon]
MANEERRLAVVGVMTFGLVSLLGDVIYEGARSVVPTYFQILGASALTVGSLLSLGEFVGYALRLLSGYASEATRAYWAFVIAGYAMLLSIPLLALTKSWQVAVGLVLLERLAKALRAPARDVLIASVSKGLGSGKAFGLHELFDQIGAVAGPAIVASTLFLAANNYELAFRTMFLPYLFLLLALFYAYRKFGKLTTEVLETSRTTRSSKGTLTRDFKLYTLSVGMNATGIFQASLILFTALLVGMEPWQVSTLYLLIQGLDALTAPISGAAFDRYGTRLLIAPFLLSIAPTILCFGGSPIYVTLAAVIFGVIYGMQESIYRAAVSQLVKPERRGSAYGWFNTVYGLGFIAGGTAMGYFVDNGMGLTAIVFSSALQLAATATLLMVGKSRSV